MTRSTGPTRLPRFEQFAAIRRYQQTLVFSPDGTQVAYSVNTSGQFNLWVQDVEGGCPQQRTLLSDQTVRTISWSPDGSTLAFNADHDGDEFYQIYVLPAHGGWPEQITSTADAQHYIGEWSPDGSWLAYSANDRERTDVDILVHNTASNEKQRLSERSGLHYFAGWAHDSRRLLAIDFLSNTNQNVYLLSFDGEPELLTPHEGDIQYLPVGWSADDSGFYFLTNADREFLGLARFNLEDHSWQYIETPEWDVEEATVSKDGHRIAWTVNEDGYSVLYVRDLASDVPFPLPDVPKGVISNLTLSNDGRRLAFFLQRATQPNEVFVVDLETGMVHQLTQSLLGGIDPADLIEPEIVRFPSFDQRQIPAFLYKPKQIDGKAPVVVSIHGGPEAQERPTYLYSGLYQYLLSRGIAILAPNLRGSTGYGLSYQKLIHRDWGGGELQDIEACVRYLRGLDWVDSERIGVFGGSFGGFATLSAVSRLPELWRAAVDLVGPSNLITFVQSVPPHWRRFMDEWVGNPERDRDLLIERSPITYTDHIKAPLFIIQGAKDPRVVKAESDQMVERLRELGRTVRYDVYDDEGHGFTKRANELKAIGDTAAWFEQHLLAKE